MNFPEKDNALFDLIKTGQIRLRDADISAIKIFVQNHKLLIEIDFAYFDQNPTRLKFSDIEEYSFYHRQDHQFRYIENFNLLKVNNLFYFTFDPENEGITTKSENDQDFILFGHFEAYLINDAIGK